MQMPCLFKFSWAAAEGQLISARWRRQWPHQHLSGRALYDLAWRTVLLGSQIHEV